MSDKRSLVDAFPAELAMRLAQQLVAIPSRNPPGEEKSCAEFIHATLRDWGIETELILKPDPERPQVVAWVSGSGQGPTFVLNGHTDTVQEGELDAWRIPPFEGRIVDGRLHGLGSCDMKGPLAVGMAVLKTIHDRSNRFPGTLMLHAAMGEEMAEDGTRTLLNLGYTGDFAVVMEPTNLAIGRANRGVSWYRLTLTGDPLHCGFAAPDVPDVMSQFARFQDALSDYHLRISQKKHPLLLSPGCRVTQAHVGERHNHLPAQGEFTIDRRMLPGESFEQVERELVHILDTVGASDPTFDYNLEYLRGNEPVELAENDPLIDVIQRNLREIDGCEADIIGMIAGTDVRNFVHDQEIPAVNFGPGDFRVCHKPNEFVPVNDLVRSGRILLGVTYDLLGG